MNCSARVWKADDLSFCKDPHCRSQTKGDFCFKHAQQHGMSHAIERASPEILERAGIPLIAKKRGRPRVPRTNGPIPQAVISSVHTDLLQGVNALPPGNIERLPMQEKIGPGEMLDLPGQMLPTEIKFVLSRSQKDWGRFAMVWSLKFPEYELQGAVVKSGEEESLNVWLRLKKQEAE